MQKSKCPTREQCFCGTKELFDASAAEDIMTAVNDWAGRLDLLVNNASLFIRTEMTSFSPPNWNALFDIHVKVPFLLSLAARPLLAKQSGSIINVTDIHAENP